MTNRPDHYAKTWKYILIIFFYFKKNYFNINILKLSKFFFKKKKKNIENSPAAFL